MLVAHYVPRPRSGGRQTRAALLGAQLVTSAEVLLGNPWDLVLIDVDPLGPDRELRDVLPVLDERGTRLVLLARTLNDPQPLPAAYELAVQIGPYEAVEANATIGPLVAVPDRSEDLDVLMVVGSADPRRWSRQARLIQQSGRELTVLARAPFKPFPGGYKGPIVTGSGYDWVGRARVVVGGGGVGTLYEALWSGGRLVASPYTEEQSVRIRLAQQAGEAIARVWALEQTLPAIERVEARTPLGKRPGGLLELRALLGVSWR